MIPHILKSLFTLLSQKWPKIGLKNLKTLGQCSKIKNILFVPVWNFEWKAIFEALPLVHIVKRCISFYSLIISPERLHDFLNHYLPVKIPSPAIGDLSIVHSHLRKKQFYSKKNPFSIFFFFKFIMNLFSADALVFSKKKKDLTWKT